MLKELYVRNFALIDELRITFSRNLTILSGETGAGKSIIVGALGLVLGDKGKTSYIRSGTDQCTVEGSFEIDDAHPVVQLLRSLGVAQAPGEDIVIRRIISTSGSSRCLVNGLQVNTRDLQNITDLLVDIHGQHEHQSLLTVKNHLFLLDRYGKLWQELETYQDCYRRAQAIQKEIEKQTMDEREKERRIDILKYSLQEIEQARLREGEEKELEEEYRILRNYEKLVSSVQSAYEFLRLSENSALTMLENALSEVQKIREYSSAIDEIAAGLESSRIVLGEAASGLKGYVEGIEYEPGKIDALQRRMEQIKGLKRKYGATIEEIKRYSEKCRVELENLESNEELIRELEKKLADERRRVQGAALSLSAQRRVSAHTLEESVQKELSYLSMGKARFRVRITYREDEEGFVLIDGKRYGLGPNGIDQVEFLISANEGEPLLPLKNVASGGELSRVMLAIKTVLGNVDPILTFVFDEIDAGIGGKVSWAVGNRLMTLAKYKQILCVTHQAQIASRGDLNIRVEKSISENRTVTRVRMLNHQEKLQEIARMISGDTITEAAVRQAEEMVREKAG
jgi:DNA repair protein RecN (Recombination protein N)